MKKWGEERMKEYRDDFMVIEGEAFKGKLIYDENKIIIELPLEPTDFDVLLNLYNSEISFNSDGLFNDRIYVDRLKVKDVRYDWSRENGYKIIFEGESVKALDQKNILRKVRNN